MKLKDARKLHNEDEVTIKKTGQVLRVMDSFAPLLDAFGKPKIILFLLTDGNYYNHKEIK